MLRDLTPLFEPSSVAVIGASSDPAKIGGRPISYLQTAGFQGTIVPINPSHDQISGIRAYPDLDAYDGGIDLALIMLSADRVVDAVERCAQRGVRTAIVFSAGFAEMGEEGLKQQDRIRDLALDTGIRVLGPNCLGVLNVGAGLMATFAGSLVSGHPVPGRIGFASQSGAVGSHCMALARERGLGISKWVTTGNEVDVDLADCIAYLAGDEETDVIVGYVEGARDGAKLCAALELAQDAAKPVIMLKAGSSAVGAEAVLSHTAALAGSDRVYDAVFEKYGVRRARSIDDLLNTAYLHAWGKPQRPETTVSMVTVQGAGAGALARTAEREGLSIAAQRRAESSAGLVAETRAALESDGSAAVLVFAPGARFDADGTDPDLLEGLVQAGSDHPGTVKVLSALCDGAACSRLEAGGWRLLAEPDAALASLGAVLGYYGERDAAQRRPAGAQESLPAFTSVLRPGMNEVEAMDLLDEMGVPTPPRVLSRSPEESVAAARDIARPVALKVVSPDIAHKSDVGGVRLGILGDDAVREAHEKILADVAPHAGRIDGILVVPMISGGLELILGLNRDPVFGPVVVCGLGGKLVELYGEVSLRMAPVDPLTAGEMLTGLGVPDLFDGAGGRGSFDLPGLAEVVSRFSRMGVAAMAAGADSIEVNPLLVTGEGEGWVALDALVVVNDTTAP